MKYKVDDKLMVYDNIEQTTHGCGVIPRMVKYKGMECKIVNMHEEG